MESSAERCKMRSRRSNGECKLHGKNLVNELNESQSKVPYVSSYPLTYARLTPLL